MSQISFDDVTNSPSPSPEPAPVSGFERAGHLVKPTRKPKHSWSPAEDAILIGAKRSGISWQEIVTRLPGRDVKSCRNRWDNMQKKGGVWTAEEDMALERAIKECEANLREYWKAVASKLEGRTWQQAQKRAQEKGVGKKPRLSPS